MNKYHFIILVFVVDFLFAQAQLIKQWDSRFGGMQDDILFSFKLTSDGGFILGGYSRSGISGDRSQLNWDTTQLSNDYWVVKVNSTGLKEWDKRYGGTNDDKLYSVIQLSDGGYLLGGFSNSGISGDVTEDSRGGYDYWAVKIDSVGNIIWDKKFGGSERDELTALIETDDQGYLLGGYSESENTGDKTQLSRGGSDYWIVKIDHQGNKMWDKRFGGTGSDWLSLIDKTSDDGFILGGSSSSDDNGDKTEPSRGGFDFWIIKIDSTGNKLWDRRYGGGDTDYLSSLLETNDGGLLLGGRATPILGGDITANTFGRFIFWIIKIDKNGNKEWDKGYSGWEWDEEVHMIKTSEGGYLLAGDSYSSSMGDKTQNNLGEEQTWIIKIDLLGNLQWDKTVFSTGEDEQSYIQPAGKNCFAIGDFTDSGFGGDKSETSRGKNDFWIIKFCDTTIYPFSGYLSHINTCHGLNQGSANVIVEGGNSPYQYRWSNGKFSSTIKDLSAGIYSVTVTDSFNTVFIDSVEITEPASAPVANFELHPSLTYEVPADIVIANNSSSYDTLIWYYDNNVISNPSGHYIVSDTGTHCFTLTVRDSFGCLDSLSQCVSVRERSNELFMPKAFTPNSDGNNDYFLIFGQLERLYDFRIRIFNRWGQQVFNSDDPYFNWDGIFNGSLQTSGVFVYDILTYFEGKQNVQHYKGYVTLIR